MKIIKNKAGFTLLEIIISLSLFVIIIILVSDAYQVMQRAYNKNSNIAELTQNARVSIDRIARELRQSSGITASLPETDTDPMNPPPSEIFFQDGHEVSQITYLRYYLSGTDLMRQHKAYYFESDPLVYVTYNSLGPGGEPPLERILEDRIIGEYFSDLKFWGANGLINISLGLSKNINNFSIKTSIFLRNH